ncbi:hypothetical protein GQ473_01805 [archaeon]|nr:hypothetical protein [archaeon]
MTALPRGLRSQSGPASLPLTKGPYEMSETLIHQKPAVDSFKRYVLDENFNQRPGLNASVGITFNVDFEILGTNVAEADVIWGTTVGGVELKTHGADNDQVIVLPHLDTLQSGWTGVLWGTENQVLWEAVIKTSDVTTGILIWAGLKLTSDPTVATDDDQAYFRFSTDDSDTNWEIVNSIGGTDTTSDSGVAVSASTNYYFRIEIDAERKAHYFINNKEVYISAAMTNDVDLIPYVGVQCLDATPSSQYLYLVKQKISRIIYE